MNVQFILLVKGKIKCAQVHPSLIHHARPVLHNYTTILTTTHELEHIIATLKQPWEKATN